MSRWMAASTSWAMRRQRGIFLLGTIAVLGASCGAVAWTSGSRWSASTVAVTAVGIVIASLLVQVLGYLVFGRPLGEVHTALQRSERRYRMLVEDASDIVLVVGPGRIDPFVAAPIASLLGRQPKAITSRGLLDIVHPDDREAVRRLFRSLSVASPKGALSLRLRHADGHDVRVDAIVRRLETEPGRAETVVTLRDVSARYRETDELRQMTHAAREAQSAADQASQAKTDFLACMSHEIRTPLNAVIGFADLLLARPELAPPSRRFGERIKVSADALLRVVDDILDFSRVEAGAIELTPAPFALPKLVDDCVSIVQQAANAKHLAVHVNLLERLPSGVLGDEARLRQVLLNLLNNAIKFTHEGSVLLDIRRDRSDGAGDRMKFSVIDTGIGIARADIPRLFLRFAQADAGIRRLYGGNGLGLAISKRLVELMGGEIGVDSEKGVGSTFWFTAPLPRAALVASGEAPRQVAGVAPMVILLVEDIAINQELARHILETAGHTVDIVGNGAEAIMAVLDFSYDIVLMDIQMPYVDGLSATRAIRALAHPHRAVPIVGVTADVLPEKTAAALEAGMIEVVHKPFAAAEIFATLGRVFGTPRPADETDGDVLAKLAGLIGEDKVRALLGSLARTLREQLDTPAATPESHALARRQAHARAPGAGMLGFTAFADACRDLERAADDEAFPAKLEALRRQAREVADEAAALAGAGRGFRLPVGAPRLTSAWDPAMFTRR